MSVNLIGGELDSRRNCSAWDRRLSGLVVGSARFIFHVAILLTTRFW